jgi:hypothetical protein
MPRQAIWAGIRAWVTGGWGRMLYAPDRRSVDFQPYAYNEVPGSTFVPGVCSREPRHEGPCNGWPCATARVHMLSQDIRNRLDELERLAPGECPDLSAWRFVAAEEVLREVEVLQDRLRETRAIGEGTMLVVSVELRKMCQRLKLTP